INYVKAQREKRNMDNQFKDCFNCGGKWPHEGVCPAKGKICDFCHGKNHFQKVCKKKKASEAAPNSSNRPNHSRNNNRSYNSNNGRKNSYNNNGNKIYQVNEQQEQPQEDKAQLFNMFYEWLESIKDSPASSSTNQ
ncbi:MAG: hypothetical protein ACOVJ8_10135, partial [Sediminibacterium sp.]